MKTAIWVIGVIAFLLNCNLLFAQNAGRKSGLKFDGMLFITDSIKTCPDGYIWEIQTLLTRDETIKETAAAKDESEQGYLYRMELKMKGIWIGGGWYYPSSLPFDVGARTQISSGNPKNFVVVAQYRIE